MTIKHLTGAYPSGYTLSAAYTGLIIESTASVGGSGVEADFNTTITNLGDVGGSRYGVRFLGGAVTNGSASNTTALITGDGYSGIAALSYRTTVTNFGTISGATRYGVQLDEGGRVTNGSNADVRATIDGGAGGISVGGHPGFITNYGTISGTSRWGVILEDGGRVTNGSATDTTALIQGGSDGVSNQGGGGR